MRSLDFTRRHLNVVISAIGVVLVLLLLVMTHSVFFGDLQDDAAEQGHSLAVPGGPPWRYGKSESAFTIVLYADLECPYCKAYYPRLKGWIDHHPEVSLEWSHLPLAMHEPAATQQARLAECAGEVNGSAAFWESVTWIYEHTRSDGFGLPANTSYPGLNRAMNACLNSQRPDEQIQKQASEGARNGIDATPTVKVINARSGESLVLSGPVEGDVLLSAMDLLSADASAGSDEKPVSPSALSSK
ncbi:disulfide bond formation protein DsbA [Kosakonia cowanii]|nr:disulfide bond formation protein DsbA [Kosakonia cowanii]